MSDGQTLPAVRYRLTAYRYPLSYWTVFPKAGGGARLRRRGDSPALPRGLRVVVSPDGDEHKMLPAAAPPLVAGATTFLHGKAGALWVLDSGVKVSLWQQRRENHTTGLRPEENRQTALRAIEMHPFCRLRRRLPRRGRFVLHSASGLISISRHSAAKTSPSGGSGAQHQKGCISTRRRRGCMVFAAKGSAAADRRHIYSLPRSGDTTTLGPKARQTLEP